MGNYLSFSVLQERMTLVRLQNLCGAQGTTLTGIVENAIERAEALVDSFAGRRYHVPLTASPLAEEWTIRITEYELYKRSASPSIPEKIREGYVDCLARLADLSDGKLTLSGETRSNTGGTSLSFQSSPSRAKI